MDTPQSIWHIELLGCLRVSRNGQFIERFPTQKTGVLLALLAFPPTRRRTRDEAAGVLWPDADGAAARDRLSQALGWLRSRLEPDDIVRGKVLATDRLAIGFHPDALTTDVALFETALLSARRATDSTVRKVALVQAVGQYQGMLLPDYYSDWILIERQRLQNAYLLALRHLSALHEQEQDYETALDYARRALAVDSLQEETHEDVLRILLATGQTAAAMRHYQELKATLARELGAEPSSKVQALMRPLTPDPARVATTPPNIRTRPIAPRSTTRANISRTTVTRSPMAQSLPSRPAALPNPLTRFFGRETELVRADALIQEGRARLVTLTGIGGAGKTRLALAIATKQIPTFGEAIVFLPAADLDDAQMLPAALATVLRLPNTDTRSAMDQAVERLSARPFLLVLDNLEHLQAGAARFVRELLDRVPTLTMLATSRQRLGLDGEHELPVAPLPFLLPTDQSNSSASMQLFVDRAQLVHPNFAITPANAAIISRICERLDGIPLAIELCAAWAQTLTPSQMLEKLDQRFELLVSRRSDITPRHRTLRAALEYSYLLLPGDLRRLFTHLSVFRGGWDLETAAICVEDADLEVLSLLESLTELRERSLIVADEIRIDENNTQMRYRMLETLREFAGKQLAYAERTAIRRAHAVYFVQLAEQAETGINGQEQEKWLTHLDREQENLRTVLAWSLETHQLEWGLRLTGALRAYWWVRGYLEEGYQWLQKLLDRAVAQETNPPEHGEPLSNAVLAKAWNALGHLTWGQSEYAAAWTAHNKALALRRAIGDKSSIAESLYHLGITAYRQQNYAASRNYLEESLALSQEENDPTGIARALLNLGNISYELQSYTDARTFFHESLSLAQSVGNRQRVRVALANLGVLAMAEKEYAQADGFLEAALVICRELTDNNGAATSLVNQATVARLRNQNERSHTLFREGLKIADEVGDKHIIAHYFLQMGILEASEENWVRSITLIGAAQHLFERVKSPGWDTHAEGYTEALATARAVLGDTEFEALLSEGMDLTLAQSVTYALNGSHSEE